MSKALKLKLKCELVAKSYKHCSWTTSRRSLALTWGMWMPYCSLILPIPYPPFNGKWGESVFEHLHLSTLSSNRAGNNNNRDIIRITKETAFLWQKQPSMWIDIKKIFMEHFHMPSPGSVSLFSLSHIFGCN